MATTTPTFTQDCLILIREVFPAWNYDLQIAAVEAEPLRCCDFLRGNGLDYLDCRLNAQGNSVIYRLNVNQVGIVGAIPPALGRLVNLEILDISTNPLLTGDLSVLSSLPLLQSLACANTSLAGPVFPLDLPYCDYSNTSLCSDRPTPCLANARGPVAPGQDSGLPTCSGGTSTNTIPFSTSPTSETPATSNPNPSTTPPTSKPSASSLPSTNTPSPVDSSLIIGLGVSIGLVVLITVACILYRIPRIRKSAYGVTKSSTPHPDIEPILVPTPTHDVKFVSDMLASSGPPPRTFSLPESRRARTDAEKKMDMDAKTPFVEANNQSEDFSVVVPHMKQRGDELVLGVGDTIVIYEVYRDGWAEGVSRRTGGPAVFPIACLGGGVPVVLAKRITGLMKVDEPTTTTPPLSVDDSSALNSVLGTPNTAPPAAAAAAAASLGSNLNNTKKVLTPSPLRSAVTLEDISESEAEEEEESEESGSEVVGGGEPVLESEKPPLPVTKVA